MTSQTRTFQRQILDAARPDHYADLYWYAEGTLPPALRQSRFGDGKIPGAYPGRLVPVVPVAPDPATTRHYAELLCGLFAASNPRIEFAPALTSIEALTTTGCAWYEWGRLDVICDGCGAVGWDSCGCRVVRRVEGHETSLSESFACQSLR